MGMGTYRNVIETFVPFGDKICTAEAADLTLASGVSNWWGIGIAALCSLLAEKSLLPTRAEETESLRLAVAAGSVDGCTRKNEMTVDHLDLETHLGILDSVDEILKKRTGPLCDRLSQDHTAPDVKNLRIIPSLASTLSGSHSAAPAIHPRTTNFSAGRPPDPGA